MAFAGLVSACVSRFGWGAAAAWGLLWGVGSPAARGAALCRSQRSMAALCRGCRVVSRREMGEASRGRSDGSIGSCRDRHAPKGTGMGLLEAKMFGLLQFFGFLGPRWSGEVCGGVKGSHVREIGGACMPVPRRREDRLLKSRLCVQLKKIFFRNKPAQTLPNAPLPGPLTISPPRGRSLAN